MEEGEKAISVTLTNIDLPGTDPAWSMGATLPEEWQPLATQVKAGLMVTLSEMTRRRTWRRPELVDGSKPCLKNSNHWNPQVKMGEMAMSVAKTNIDLPGTDLAWPSETLPEEWQPLENPK